MSGFGAPDFTATPIGDLTRSTRLSATTFPCLIEIAERVAGNHDQHVRRLAASSSRTGMALMVVPIDGP